MAAGDESASAYFHVDQVAAAHLIVKQVTGQAGQAGCFVDGIGQPFSQVWFSRAELWRKRVAGSRPGRTIG